MKKQWCIPAKSSSEFVARMEDVLETYALPYNPEIPLICMDEQPIQLVDHSFVYVYRTVGRLAQCPCK